MNRKLLFKLIIFLSSILFLFTAYSYPIQSVPPVTENTIIVDITGNGNAETQIVTEIEEELVPWDNQLEKLPALILGKQKNSMINYPLEYTLKGEHEFSSVEIFSGGILKVKPFNNLKLRANLIEVHKNGFIISQSGRLEFEAHTIILNGVIYSNGDDFKQIEFLRTRGIDENEDGTGENGGIGGLSSGENGSGEGGGEGGQGYSYELGGGGGGGYGGGGGAGESDYYDSEIYAKGGVGGKTYGSENIKEINEGSGGGAGAGYTYGKGGDGGNGGGIDAKNIFALDAF